MQLRGTDILVMGLGVHGGGLGVVRWLLRQGANLTITDMATADALAQPLAQVQAAAADAGATVRTVLGQHRADDFAQHAMVVANPAVRPDSPWLAIARDAGVPIETEMTLFFHHCPGPVLGVTGTKGKTTTALLLGAMLRQQWPDTVVAGNMRVSALAALDQIAPTTPVVLELSSFQLTALDTARLSPPYACITNLSPDHLNYHGSLAEYARAKQAIFAHQDQHGMVLLPHDETHDSLLWPVPSYQGTLQTFDPQPNAAADATVTADGAITLDGEVLLQVDDIRLPGRHNIANVLAAATLARRFGASPATIQTAVRQFAGVEHRLELVRELDSVRYINDTTATNPAAAQAALASVEPPIVLVAGGADKALDFAAFAAAIVQRAAAVVWLAGSATEHLQAAVHAAGAVQAHGPFDDFSAAITAARACATPGGAVLLSPGCASFGMFRNEFHRGEEFRRIVKELRTSEASVVRTPE